MIRQPFTANEYNERPWTKRDMVLAAVCLGLGALLFGALLWGAWSGTTWQ
jgi:hypothetical protein